MAKIGVTLSAACAAALLIGLGSAQASTIPSFSQTAAAPEQAGLQLADNKGSRQYHGYQGAGQGRNAYGRNAMPNDRDNDRNGRNNGNNNNNNNASNNNNNSNSNPGGPGGRRGGRGR